MLHDQVTIEPLAIAGCSSQDCQRMTEAIEKELVSWEFTRYRPECRVKQRGVDCVQFVAAMLAFMSGIDPEFKTLPPDASFHNPELARAKLRELLRLWPNHAVKGMVVQPGDAIICGPSAGGPGHVMIVGTTHLWHTGGRTVCKAGLTWFGTGTDSFKEIRRLDDRATWISTILA